MNLKSKPTPHECAVVRCKKPPGGQYSVVGALPQYLCYTHGEVAQKGDQGLVEVDPEILSTDLVREEVRIHQEETDEALDFARGFEIVSAEDLELVEAARAEAKGKWKELEAKRQTVSKPLNEAIRAHNALFKPVLTALEALGKCWDDSLRAYRARCEAERAEAIAIAHAAEAPEEIREAVMIAAEAVPQNQGTMYIDHWVFEIEDESKIPREYLLPDLAKIGQVVKAMKESTSIQGVNAFNRPIVRGR